MIHCREILTWDVLGKCMWMAQELHLKVKMCCLKCEEIAVEAIREVPGKHFPLQISSSYIHIYAAMSAPRQPPPAKSPLMLFRMK